MNPSVLCFRKLPVAKKFMDKRGGEFQDFPSKIFCLTVPKISVGGGSFSVSLISGIEKFYASEGYVTIFDFLSKFFCLTVPKISVEESFTVAIISGIEKVWIKGGVSRFSVEVYVSLYLNISLENTLVFQKNSFIENFHA